MVRRYYIIPPPSGNTCRRKIDLSWIKTHEHVYLGILPICMLKAHVHTCSSWKQASSPWLGFYSIRTYMYKFSNMHSCSNTTSRTIHLVFLSIHIHLIGNEANKFWASWRGQCEPKTKVTIPATPCFGFLISSFNSQLMPDIPKVFHPFYIEKYQHLWYQRIFSMKIYFVMDLMILI